MSRIIEIPKASIIIPFFGKCHVLNETFISLCNQTENDFEIILIDDESPENPKNLIKEYENRLQINYIRIQNKGKSFSRNLGSKYSKSNNLIFLDSDMIVENNWFKKIKEHINSFPNSILVGEGFRDPGKPATVFHSYIIETEQKWQLKNKGKSKISFKNFKFTACNLFLSKEIFISLGGFNEALLDGEDFDLGIRALKKEYAVYADSSIKSYHNDWPTIRDYIKRNNQYNKGKKALITLYPEYVNYLANFSLPQKNTIKKNIVLIFSKIINPLTLNNSWLLKYIPKKTCFYLFRITISSLTE